MEGQEDQARTVREDNVPIHSNKRFTIPVHARRGLGLERGDMVQCAAIFEDGKEHFSSELDKRNRVGIPSRIFNERGIEDGDNIDVEISNV